MKKIEKYNTTSILTTTIIISVCEVTKTSTIHMWETAFTLRRKTDLKFLLQISLDKMIVKSVLLSVYWDYIVSLLNILSHQFSVIILSIGTNTGLRPGEILWWTLRGQEIKSNFHLIATNQSQSYIAMTNLPALCFSREMLDCSVISGTTP